ncbi:MAG: metal ABC transporter permease [Gammaproteobacteria bacterium]
MYDFLFRATLAGIGIALLCAPLGSLVVWRRLSYFGDTLSHAALLGVALSAAFSFATPFYGILFSAILISLFLLFMEHRTRLPSDTLLGILAHGSLALGIVVISLLPSFRTDLYAYLFGDILGVSMMDIARIYAMGTVVLLIIGMRWRALLMSTVHEDLAAVDGIHVARERMILTLLLACVVALSIKILGVLLITAMLVIPPAAARPFACNPEQMVIGAAVTGVLAVIGGLLSSLWFDLPAGPMIVLSSVALFVLAHGTKSVMVRP